MIRPNPKKVLVYSSDSEVGHRIGIFLLTQAVTEVDVFTKKDDAFKHASQKRYSVIVLFAPDATSITTALLRVQKTKRHTPIIHIVPFTDELVKLDWRESLCQVLASHPKRNSNSLTRKNRLKWRSSL